ncbi:TatD family hydrolase [Patescibacteria group bacterium]|nr:TatD family hydrolase [Patescibacteria group bacterium]
MYIDTHTHLNLKAFEDDWREVADRAKKAGVEKMLVVGTDLESSQKALALAEEVEGLFAVAGFHPHHCKGITKTQIDKIIEKLKKLAKHKKVVAIGECGLDYHVYQKTKYPSTSLRINKTLEKLQKQVFGKQIQLAKSLNLPMVIHNRKAQKDILDVMDHFCQVDGKYPRGVFHCISGSVKFLKLLLERGFYIGVDGNVTYSSEVKALAKETPLDKLLLETDSPWLTPVPHRSLRNEPSNVKIVAEFVAKLKKTSINQIATITTRNAENLFNI